MAILFRSKPSSLNGISLTATNKLAPELNIGLREAEQGGERVASFLLQDGEHLYGAIQLRIHPRRVRGIEWHLDRWRDTDPFEALTIDEHVRDR